MEGDSLRFIFHLAVLSVLCFLYLFFLLISVAINRSQFGRAEELEEQGVSGAKTVLWILGRADRYILTAQLGMFLTAVLIGSRIYRTDAEVNILSMFGVNGFDGDAGWFTRSTLVILVALIIFATGQFVKAVTSVHPERTLSYVALPVVLLGRVIAPVFVVIRKPVAKLLSLFGIPIASERRLSFSSEELVEMVERSTEEGSIEEEEGDMIQGVVEFSETVVREVMTPRTDVIAVSEEASLEEIVATFSDEGKSRVLVIGDTLDEVRGVILAKDLLSLFGKSSDNFKIRDVLREISFVQNAKPIDDLLAQFRREASHIAVVLDEHGGVDGVVTLEDLLEEIVGEIFDEFDSPEAEVKETLSGDLLVDGSMPVDDINEEHGFSFPTGAYDTLAGFVIHLFGRMPEAFEEISFEEVNLRVEALEQNRITRVRITLENSSGSKPLAASESNS